jgi:hypothetical protein
MSVGARKFCPACHLLNDMAATECEHCGVPFEGGVSSAESTTTHVGGDTSYLTPETQAALENMERDVPENGLALFLANHDQPFDVRTDDDFILGRKMGEPLGTVVDLTPFNAFSMGISRQHARIQRVENGYQITDLNSTNGTWLNEGRLPPDQPVPLPNAAQIRLGRMRLYVIYRLKKNN